MKRKISEIEQTPKSSGKKSSLIANPTSTSSSSSVAGEDSESQTSQRTTGNRQSSHSSAESDDSSTESDSNNTGEIPSTGTKPILANKTNGHSRFRSSSASSSSALSDASDSITTAHKPVLPDLYKPPSTFTRIAKKTGRSVNIQRLLDTTDGSGIRLWHIAAPVSVNLRAIDSATVNKRREGDVIFNFGGTDYVLVQNKVAAAHLLLSPDGGASYEAKIPLNESRRLKRVVPDYGVGITDSPRTPLTRPTVIKKVPIQLPGLRTRYWPSGFEASSSMTTVQDDVQKVDIKKAKSKTAITALRVKNNSAGNLTSTDTEEGSEDESDDGGSSSGSNDVDAGSSSNNDSSDEDSESSNEDSSSSDGSDSGQEIPMTSRHRKPHNHTSKHAKHVAERSEDSDVNTSDSG